MSTDATIATHNERARCAQLVINFFLDAGAEEAQATAQPLVAAILRPTPDLSALPVTADDYAPQSWDTSLRGKRHTFVIPDGHEAVRDEAGRATGETRTIATPCACISYNLPEPWQTVPETILTVPSALRDEIGRQTICVDACIAHLVEGLWAEGIVTRSACCGHNGGAPRHVVVDEAFAERARHWLTAHGETAMQVLLWARLEQLPDGQRRIDPIFTPTRALGTPPAGLEEHGNG